MLEHIIKVSNNEIESVNCLRSKIRTKSVSRVTWDSNRSDDFKLLLQGQPAHRQLYSTVLLSWHATLQFRTQLSKRKKKRKRRRRSRQPVNHFPMEHSQKSRRLHPTSRCPTSHFAVHTWGLLSLSQKPIFTNNCLLWPRKRPWPSGSNIWGWPDIPSRKRPYMSKLGTSVPFFKRRKCKQGNYSYPHGTGSTIFWLEIPTLNWRGLQALTRSVHKTSIAL